jgi:hypothetical protein
MLVEELIGKTITNIYQILNYDDGGLDNGECFVELDNKLIIEIPYSFDSFNDEVSIKELKEKTVSIFNDLKDYPVYHVNKERKSIKEIIDKYADMEPILLEKFKQLIFRQKPVVQSKHIVEYKPCKIEYVESKLKYLKNRIIKDLITFGSDDEKYFFELDNGYYVTETKFSPNGTGRIGINLYENINDITSWKGNDFKRFANQKK